MIQPRLSSIWLLSLSILSAWAWGQNTGNDPAKEDFFLSARKTFRIRFEPKPNPIPRNQPFALEIWVRDKGGNTPEALKLSVDARMPDHRHGMVRVPKITTIAPGHFKVTNMLFHMPGRWVLHFDMTHAGLTERGSFEIHLE